MKWLRKQFQMFYMAIALLLGFSLYRLVFLLSFFLLFFILLFIPVLTTPGNDVLFQLHVWGLPLTLTLILLSVCNGLLLTMQIYAYRHGGLLSRSAHGSSFLGVFVALFVGLFSCAACYSGFISLAGIGFASFFAIHQIPLLTFAFLVVIWALWHNSRRILGHCESCKLTK